MLSHEQPKALGPCKICKAELYRDLEGRVKSISNAPCFPGEAHTAEVSKSDVSDED